MDNQDSRRLEIYAEMMEQSARKASCYKERYRPQFHFSNFEGWINDPNGLVYYDGEYHLFYQQRHPLVGGMNWGHAVSKDLVSWDILPLALLSHDRESIFSGSAVVDWNNTSGFFGGKSGLVAIYTVNDRVDGQMQCIAYSSDKGRTWTKYAGNPVIPSFGDFNFRDPKVFWHEQTNQWVMVVGVTPLRLYGSKDLKNWDLLSENSEISSECPDLFEMPVDGDPENRKWVLTLPGNGYYIGSFDGIHFKAETELLKLYGGREAYATQSFSDIPHEDGRRILVDWISGLQKKKNLTEPFEGFLSIPHTIKLKTFPEGPRLVHQPVKELEKLRNDGIHLKDIQFNGPSEVLKSVHGTALEIILEADVSNADEFCLSVREGNPLQSGRTEKTIICYQPAKEELLIDASQSGYVDYFGSEKTLSVPVRLEDGFLKLHIFVDWSSVELFINDGKQYALKCILPSLESAGLSLCSKGAVTVTKMDIYQLNSIWGEPEKSILQLSRGLLDLQIGEAADLLASVLPNAREKIIWRVDQPDRVALEIKQHNHAVLKALQSGDATVTAAIENGMEEQCLVRAYHPGFISNIPKWWPCTDNQWRITSDGVIGTASGSRLFYFADESRKNFTVELNMTFSAVAGLKIRNKHDFSDKAGFNILLDANAGMLILTERRFWRDYRQLSACPADFGKSATHHLKVSVVDNEITVSLDHIKRIQMKADTPEFDSWLKSIALTVWESFASFQDVNLQ